MGKGGKRDRHMDAAIDIKIESVGKTIYGRNKDKNKKRETERQINRER